MPTRRWNEPIVLGVIAIVVIGAFTLGILLRPTAPTSDSADAGFARDMAQHHAQLVELAELARDRTDDPEIRTVASNVSLTAQKEIGEMRASLEAWDLPAAGDEEPMTWMGHPTEGPLPGMATPDEIDTLRGATGSAADRLFLQLAIRHLRGGILLAGAAQELAETRQMRALAFAINQYQTAEIRVMQTLLGRVGGTELLGAITMPAAHGEHGGHRFTDAIGDTAQVAPIGMALLAGSWLMLDGHRRRRHAKHVRDGVVRLPHRLAVAVLTGAAGLLHLGLIGDHFAESALYGWFFAAAAAAQLLIAASVLANPTRRAVASSVGVNLFLVMVYVLFRIVPPPGATVPEEIDSIGQVTVGLQALSVLVGAIAAHSNRALSLQSESTNI